MCRWVFVVRYHCADGVYCVSHCRRNCCNEGLLATDVGFCVEGSPCWDLIQHSKKGDRDCCWVTGRRPLVNMTSDSVDVDTTDGIVKGGTPCTDCSALLVTAHLNLHT